MICSCEEFYRLSDAYAESLKNQKQKIMVCTGSQCIANGAMKIFEQFQQLIIQKGLSATVSLAQEQKQDAIAVKKTGCIGLCGEGALIQIQPAGILYVHVHPGDCEEILEKTLIGGEIIERLLFVQEGNSYATKQEIPYYALQHKLVAEQCGMIDAESIEEYIATGGYRALAKVLTQMTPAQICDEMLAAGLRGRGGGGFSVGKKWAEVLKQTADEKFIIGNGDEGNPGAFMDGCIMEGNPHSVIEGMIIGGYATGSTKGYIYVRAEYPLAVKRLSLAIEQAKQHGLLGEHILGSDYSLEIVINQGAGAFVCGESSALISSIEGKRGIPRVKPPRTAEKGLFQKPTVLNNVETFATVPCIINNGSEWYIKIGVPTSPGTKTFSVGGHVNLTGMIEVDMGTTLRQVVYDICGGMKNGKKFKAVQIGGPSGAFITEEQLDVPLDFDSLARADAMMGAGGLVILNEDVCMVEMARFFMHFTQHESCGKCTPCREGTKHMLNALDRIVSGRGSLADIDLLEMLGEVACETALCGLGKTAALPVLSSLKHFRQEYLDHIEKHYCAAGVCELTPKTVIEEIDIRVIATQR